MKLCFIIMYKFGILGYTPFYTPSLNWRESLAKTVLQSSGPSSTPQSTAPPSLHDSGSSYRAPSSIRLPSSNGSLVELGRLASDPSTPRQENRVCLTKNARPIAKRLAPLGGSTSVRPAGVTPLVRNVPQKGAQVAKRPLTNIPSTSSAPPAVPSSVRSVPTRVSLQASRNPEVAVRPANAEVETSTSRKHLLERSDSNLGESEFRGQVLKMMRSMLEIAEEQRSLKVVKERVIWENVRYFTEIVNSNVRLPLSSPAKLEELNGTLVEVEFSVAMASVLIVRLKSMLSRDQIAKMAMSHIMDSSLCKKVTWKKRGADKRPMIGHLVYFIAVLGGKIFYNYFVLSVLLTAFFLPFFCSGCQNGVRD